MLKPLETDTRIILVLKLFESRLWVKYKLYSNQKCPTCQFKHSNSIIQVISRIWQNKTWNFPRLWPLWDYYDLLILFIPIHSLYLPCNSPGFCGKSNAIYEFYWYEGFIICTGWSMTSVKTIKIYKRWSNDSEWLLIGTLETLLSFLWFLTIKFLNGNGINRNIARI